MGAVIFGTFRGRIEYVEVYDTQGKFINDHVDIYVGRELMVGGLIDCVESHVEAIRNTLRFKGYEVEFEEEEVDVYR